jgi:CheY-like chemotaxis protein
MLPVLASLAGGRLPALLAAVPSVSTLEKRDLRPGPPTAPATRGDADVRSTKRHALLLHSALRYAFVMPQASSVLLVEDEREVRELVAEVLTMAGYRLFVAEDGAEAARLLETDQAIDLLLTDVRMPNLDGFALAERFVKARPTGKVLYLTGFPDHMQRAEDPRLHGKMLWKPFRPSELLREIQTTLASTTR